MPETDQTNSPRSDLIEPQKRARTLGLQSLQRLRGLTRMLIAGLLVALAAAVIALELFSARQAMQVEARAFAGGLSQVISARLDSGQTWAEISASLQPALVSLASRDAALEVSAEGEVIAISNTRPAAPLTTIEAMIEVPGRAPLVLIYRASMRTLLMACVLVLAVAAVLAVLLMVLAERLVLQRWMLAEQSRQRLAERIADIADASSDWYWEINSSYRFTLCTLAGDGAFSSNALLGRRIWDSAAITIRGGSERIRDMMADKKPINLRCRAEQGGRLIWYELRGKPFFDDNAVFQGYRGSARNVSVEEAQANQLKEHRDELVERVEEQTRSLRDAKRAAEEANESKSRFLADISHEIRTPMSSILGLAQLALSDDLSAKNRGYFEKIQRAGRHLLNIVNDVLDLSKIDSGKLELLAEPFNLSACMHDAVDIVSDQALAKKLTLLSELPSGDEQWLIGDEIRLRQIVLNLMGNAVKFTDDGEVRLEAALTPQSGDGVQLRVSVSDTGPGIEPARQATLFTDFEQGGADVSKRFGGSGLGLSICSRLVELMGGEIGVDSEPGNGSVFWFRVPLRRCAPHQIPVQPDADGAGLPGASLAATTSTGERPAIKVLLVEDNPFNQEVTAQILQEEGIEVALAEDGRQALDKMASGEFDDIDVILMDYNMPVMDGIESARCIRALPRFGSIPIIALTANVMQDDRRRFTEAGMCDFVSKPTDYALLIEKTLYWAGQGSTDSSGREASPEAHDPGVPANTELPVLDTAVGLQMCMQQAPMYARMLRRFCQSEADVGDRLNAAMAAGDLESVARLVHTLKGVTAQLGGVRASAKAVEVDAICKRYSMGAVGKDAVQAGLEPLIEVVNELLVAVRIEIDQQQAGADSEAGVASNDDEPYDLGRLLKWIELGDTEALNYVRENGAIMERHFGPRMRALVAQLEDYDFEAAAVTMAQMTTDNDQGESHGG